MAKSRAQGSRPLPMRGSKRNYIEIEDDDDDVVIVGASGKSPAKKKWKSVMQEVVVRQQELEVSHDTATMPNDWKLVNNANGEIMEWIKDRCRKRGIRKIYSASSNDRRLRKNPSLMALQVARHGFYFPPDIVKEAERWFTISIRDGKVSNSKKMPPVNEMRSMLKEAYPNMPKHTQDEVIRRLDPAKGSKIGRAADVPFWSRMNLCVVAHARHTQTDYDKMLRQGQSKDQARKDIQQTLHEVIEKWRGEQSKEAKFVKVYRESIDLTSLSDDDDDYEPAMIVTTPPKAQLAPLNPVHHAESRPPTRPGYQAEHRVPVQPDHGGQGQPPIRANNHQAENRIPPRRSQRAINHGSDHRAQGQLPIRSNHQAENRSPSWRDQHLDDHQPAQSYAPWPPTSSAPLAPPGYKFMFKPADESRPPHYPGAPAHSPYHAPAPVMAPPFPPVPPPAFIPPSPMPMRTHPPQLPANRVSMPPPPPGNFDRHQAWHTAGTPGHVPNPFPRPGTRFRLKLAAEDDPDNVRPSCESGKMTWPLGL